jgi:hypothetical protein
VFWLTDIDKDGHHARVACTRTRFLTGLGSTDSCAPSLWRAKVFRVGSRPRTAVSNSHKFLVSSFRQLAIENSRIRRLYDDRERIGILVAAQVPE